MTMFWGAWIGLTLGAVVVLALLGVALRGSFWGLVLDEDAVVSVLKVQLVAWTVGAGPLVLAMAMWRLTVAPPGLDLGTPGQLVGLMAITLGSALGATALMPTPGDADEGSRRHVDLVEVQSLVISTGVLIGYVSVVIAGYVHVPVSQAPATLPTLSPSWLIILALSQSACLLSAVASRDAGHAEEAIAPLASRVPMAA